MKKLFSITLIVIMFLASSFKFDKGDTKGNNSKIEVVFNRHLEFNDIVKIKLDLSQKGIVLNFKKLEFDEYGKLKAISFLVDCKDGFSGSATETNLINQSRFGFYRDYTKDAKSPFGTGEL